MTRNEVLKILEQVYNDTKYKPKLYKHICSGGNTVLMLETYSKQEFINCRHKGRSVWDSPWCNNCNGLHQGYLTLDEDERFENYGMDKLYRNLEVAVLAVMEEKDDKDN